MTFTNELAARRIAVRTSQLGAIAATAEHHAATALHFFGSLGRGTADAWSDIDAIEAFLGMILSTSEEDGGRTLGQGP